jgi:hypothetical protein
MNIVTCLLHKKYVAIVLLFLLPWRQYQIGYMQVTDVSVAEVKRFKLGLLSRI